MGSVIDRIQRERDRVLENRSCRKKGQLSSLFWLSVIKPDGTTLDDFRGEERKNKVRGMGGKARHIYTRSRELSDLPRESNDQIRCRNRNRKQRPCREGGER